MVQVAWLAYLKPCPLYHAKIGHLVHCTVENLQPCPLCCGKIGSLASNLIPLSLLLPDETHPALSWWTQACLQSLPRLPFVAGGFWAVILSRSCAEEAGQDM